MVAPRYLAALAIGMLLWCGLFLGFIWVIDPYGVSPLHMSINRVNEFKPKRVDIDRVIKPYEVWRYQPKTVFLGSSRIHQALDPAVLDGTSLAPAYNASIPASTLSENAAQLKQFLALDPNLKVVIIELFFSNFILPIQEVPDTGFTDFAGNAMALLLSATAVNDSINTLWVNRRGTYEGPRVAAGGHWLPPRAPYTKRSFEAYVDSIMTIHQKIPDLALQPTVFAAVDRIVELCRARGVKLHLIIAPHHPYDDYRWLSLGYGPLLETWYRKLATYPGVISFAQYHAPLEEPINERMEYWYDPLHVSLKMGSLMLRSLVGRRDPDIPENMLVPVNRDNVEQVLTERSKGLEAWVRKNPEFVAEFDAAKLATRNDEASRRWARENPKLAAELVAAERRGEIIRRGAGVAHSLASLSELEQQLASRYPASQINEYRNITRELLAAHAVPREMIRGRAVENAWRGPFNTQVFPANAWRTGVAATYNFVFEGVPRNDCARLVTALGRRAESLLFRINLEPSGKIHEKFPVVGDEGCREGANSIGYTVMAR